MDLEALLKKDYVQGIVAEGKRIDGRGFDERRPITVTKGFAAEKAPGSARINLGGTDIIVGISMGLGEPYSDSPEDGVMTTSTEFRPIADPNFELGPPREDSIEVARVIDRGIRESGAIDTGKLLIEEGKIWMVFIDIHILNNAGNLFDAGGIAAIAALLDARMPKYEDGNVIRGEWDGKLPITCTPIPLTIAKIAGNLVADPCLDEEYGLDARLTVTTTDTVNAMQKGGTGSLTIEEVEAAVDMAFAKSEEVRKLVEK
ncbi:MAG: exosome complex protein Rrp42 [Candidatus Altiarchaeota archaeon]